MIETENLLCKSINNNDQKFKMKNTITNLGLKLPENKGVYHGKVREVVTMENDQLLMIVTDRISCFDVVLPKGIPYKGQVLNQLAEIFLDSTKDIVPNWKLSTPDPNVMVGYNCEPFKVEMIVRAYLSGHAWREYRDGKREICGVALPEWIKENDRLPRPILTPSTKADQGMHDEDISRNEILKQGLVSEEDYEKLEQYSLALFQRGTELAAAKGLILVDTKYEFGKYKDEIYLIDEIHTPDSSRYFYKEGYDERQKAGESQKQLSKEFVREWLIEHGFQGKEGQEVPELKEEFINSVSERYIELFENLTGKPFEKAEISNIEQRIEKNITNYLNK
jgi:phosphoribosylaminoimidazole-succinocarboxamide synthase